jgi:hypothetical protein
MALTAFVIRMTLHWKPKLSLSSLIIIIIIIHHPSSIISKQGINIMKQMIK